MRRHLVAFKREDKSGLLRFDIAFASLGALGMGFGAHPRGPRQRRRSSSPCWRASDGCMVTNPAAC